jgi:hypothetical protein
VRARAARVPSQQWCVPQLLLCLGSLNEGRLKTLRFITHKLRNGVPVLFVPETKGVAGLVSRFMETLRPLHTLALQNAHHLDNRNKAKDQKSEMGRMPNRTHVEPALIPWKARARSLVANPECRPHAHASMQSSLSSLPNGHLDGR